MFSGVYCRAGDGGFEPATSSLGSKESTTVTPTAKGLMETVSAVCTSESATNRAEMLQSLAVALRASLPAEDCHRLAMLLEAPDDLPTDRPG